MLEPDGKARLLKTLHALALTVGHGEINLGWNWKVPGCWLALITPEVALQAAGGETVTNIPAWLWTLHAKY